MYANEKILLNRIKFFILIILQIPSIILTLLIFIFFLTHRHSLHILQNQALFILLIITFFQLTIDLPMPINFYRIDYVTPATATFCTWWSFIEYTLSLTSILLMATISLQRHLLIFHAHILHNHFKRYVFYYLPLIFCIIYPLVFYIIVILFYPCDGTQWDFTLNLCGNTVCYNIDNRVLNIFDWTVNYGLSNMIIFLGNLSLIIRVINQRLRHHHHISWRKQRRMTLQLLSISSLYLFAWIPNLIISVILQIYSLNILADIQTKYIMDCLYLIWLLLPWIYLGLLPEFTKWIWKYLSFRNIIQNAIRPV